MLTLINAMESHFRTSLVSNDMLNAWWSENPGSISSFLSTSKIQFVCVLWRVRAVCEPQDKEALFALMVYIQINIFIYITLHTYYLDKIGRAHVWTPVT